MLHVRSSVGKLIVLTVEGYSVDTVEGEGGKVLHYEEDRNNSAHGTRQRGRG